MADVNGDGKGDMVGFGYHGVSVSLSKETYFQTDKLWISYYGRSTRAGEYTSFEKYPRILGDVNGDGKADVIGFSTYDVEVSLSTGTSFASPEKWLFGLCVNQGWSSFDKFPRMTGDVDGDGDDDLIGFGPSGIMVCLSERSYFSRPVRWIKDMCTNQTWSGFDRYPRMIADVTGDGKADAIGITSQGIFVAKSTGSQFLPKKLWLVDMGNNQTWTSFNRYPRMAVDVNRDNKADIVGFASSGIYICLSTGSGLRNKELWLQNFCVNQRWGDYARFPRMVADVTGDGSSDIIGCASYDV